MVAPGSPLSVVIAARGGWPEAARAIEVVCGEVATVGGDVVVVSGAGDDRDLGPAGRWISTREQCILTLRARGVLECAGAVLAVGEDHAVPHPGWAERIVTAHQDHPDADLVAGCLVNGTAGTLAGRANFLAFAAAWAPPMPTLPAHRPPPLSAVSIKRRALGDGGGDDGGGRGYRGAPGELEAEVLPRLFAEGRAVADDRIRVDHYQDHGLPWSIANAFASARSSYGTVAIATPSAAARRRQARWALENVPRTLVREAWARPEATKGDRAAVVPIAVAAGAGAAIGALTGRGRSGERVA